MISLSSSPLPPLLLLLVYLMRKIMKTSVQISSLWGEILMQYLPDMKEC
jgi:hypothetical protein